MSTPEIQIDKFLEKGLKFYRYRWSLVRLFQRLYGEASMGNFISYTNRIWEAMPVTTDWCEKIIDAYIHYVTLPRILSKSGKEIVQNPILDAYFSKWGAYREYKRRWMDGSLEKAGKKDKRGFFEKLAHLLRVDVIIDHLDDVINYVGLGAELLAGYILAMGEELYLGKMGIPHFIHQQLERGAFYVLDYLTHAITVDAWDPFYDFDWAVISSQIALLETYKKTAEAQERIRIPAFIAGQRVWVGPTPRKAAWVARVDEEGKAWIFIPRELLEGVRVKEGPGEEGEGE